MRVLSLGGALADFGVEPIALGFSPVDALRELAEYLKWPYRFLSDPDRSVYNRLGLGRAGPRSVFNTGTRAIYRDAARRGISIRRPVEDIRQLGGDAVSVDGTVVALWRPESPDARPPVEAMVETVESLFS